MLLGMGPDANLFSCSPVIEDQPLAERAINGARLGGRERGGDPPVRHREAQGIHEQDIVLSAGVSQLEVARNRRELIHVNPLKRVADHIYIHPDRLFKAVPLRGEPDEQVLRVQRYIERDIDRKARRHGCTSTLPSSISSPVARISAEPMERTGRLTLCDDHDITW